MARTRIDAIREELQDPPSAPEPPVPSGKKVKTPTESLTSGLYFWNSSPNSSTTFGFG